MTSDKIKYRDEECFGWLYKDGTFEQEPMPGDWRYDFRGAQILESRMRHGYTEPPIYLPGGRPRTLEEIFGGYKHAAKATASPLAPSLWRGLVILIVVCITVGILSTFAK